MTCLKNIKSVLSAGRSPCVSVYVRVWLWCLCVCTLTLPRSALINGKVSNWRVSIIPKWRIQGGAPNVRPPTAQNFLDFMQFLGKFDKIVCWRPPGGRRPLLQGILDPPLNADLCLNSYWIFVRCFVVYWVSHTLDNSFCSWCCFYALQDVRSQVMNAQTNG